MRNRSFQTFNELLDLLKRGGEVVLKYEGLEFSLIPCFDDGVDNPVTVSVAVWHNTAFEDLGDFLVGNRRIRDIANESDVLFRPDK